MHGPRGYHTKWSESDTERQILCDVSYFGILKKNDRNELIYETETDSFHLENELWLPGRQRGQGQLEIWG